MKKVMIFVLLLAILAGVGYALYETGVLSKMIERVVSRGPSSTATAGGATQPVTEGRLAGAPAGGAVGAEGPPPAAPVAQPAIAQPGQGVANKSIEVRVVSVRTAPTIGSASAGQGREYVIVDTAWTNLIPKVKVNRKKAQDRTAGMGALGFGGGATDKDRADDEANSTIESVAFEVSPLSTHLWLVVNGRLAEPIDEDATKALETHLGPDKVSIREFQQVVSGSIAFEAPAGAQALSLLYLDSANGHLLLPIKGALPQLASSLGGSSHGNEFVDLAVTGTTWAEAGEGGMKTLVVSVKGISRQDALVDVPFGEFGFLQTDQGCIAQPEEHASAVARSLAPIGRFLPMVPSEGQVAFIVPADTKSAVLMLRARPGTPIDLPVLGDGSVQKPSAAATHQDGSILRVGVIGTGKGPADLPAPPEGSEYLVVDYLVENLEAGSGVELQTEPQFALADASGKKYEPESEGTKLPCRLSGDNVVPAGGWRRFSLLYTVPVGQPLTLQYRGFASTGTLKVR